MNNSGRKYKHPLYNTWVKIKQKSTKPNHLGRIISIPDEWQSFEGFLSDLPKKPKEEGNYVLSRIYIYEGYSSHNIYWKKVKRKIKSNTTTCNTSKINTSVDDCPSIDDMVNIFSKTLNKAI